MKPLKVATVLGTRPQFIKAAAVSWVFREANAAAPPPVAQEVLIHTGQHYDYEMSLVFFEEFEIPTPKYHLGVGSGPHGRQTGEMLSLCERALSYEEPDLVLVYGDTNSTLAGVLAAAKLGLPVAHVEAGLRSFNRRMPEEINRVVTDRLAAWLFCPSERAVENLAAEGITEGVELVGDVMQDVLLWHLSRTREPCDIVDRLKLEPGTYAVATVHRAQNTDHHDRLVSIMDGLEGLVAQGIPVVLPLHPRTRRALKAAGRWPQGVKAIPAIGHREMLDLQSKARVVLTDSGGIQKEAYWLGVPCVTFRDETEWQETVATGWNILVGDDTDLIVEVAMRGPPDRERPPLYGRGAAAKAIVARVLRGTNGLREAPERQAPSE